MVLAAGYGQRMRPLTLYRAKPALPVLNRPLIHHTLELLARHGVREVVVNLHHLPQTLRTAIGRRPPGGLRVTYAFEETILGTGGGARQVRRLLGNAPCLLVNGDVLFDFDLGALLARHNESGAAVTLALRPNPDPDRYPPVITARDGQVRWLPGIRRRCPGTAHLFTGVQVLDPGLLERLAPGPADTVRDLYAPLVREGARLLGVRVRGPWYDLGYPSSYLATQLRLLSRAGAPRHSLLHPEARLARGARVQRSVVGRGARLGAGARVERSVLWEGVEVGSGALVQGSILAEGACVPPGARVLGRCLTRHEDVAIE
jgi:mannose-1-phosphate guanylyltransferase